MTVGEMIYSCIVPMAGLLAFLVGTIQFKQGINFKNITICIIGLVVMAFSINDSIDNNKLKGINSRNMDSLHTVLADVSKKINRDSAFLHHLDSLGVRWDSINNKPVVTKSFIRYISNYYPNTIPSTISNQRYLNTRDLDTLKKIPKVYPITILYNQDAEASNFTKQIREKLLSLGYTIKEISPSMLGGIKWNDHFDLNINHANKTADITVFQLDNLTQ